MQPGPVCKHPPQNNGTEQVFVGAQQYRNTERRSEAGCVFLDDGSFEFTSQVDFFPIPAGGV